MALNVDVNHGAQGSSKSQFSIDSQVNLWQVQASSLPFRHPDRAWIAHNIANFHFGRYKATRQKGDIDQAIVGYTEALLRRSDHPLQNISTFDHLTRALAIRFNDFRAREDLDHIISYFRHLSNLPLGAAGIKRLDVLISLADALHSRFEVGGRLEDIEDLISLLRPVITMVPPGTDDYPLIASRLGNAWKRKYDQTSESEDLTEAISHHRARGDLNDIKDAATLYEESLDLLDKEHPDRMWVLTGLANVYHVRFMQTDDSEDLEKTISQYREILLLCPPGYERKVFFLMNLGLSLINRFEMFGRMDCLEEATSHYRAALRLCPPGHPRRQLSLRGLAHTMHLRCHRTQRIEDSEEAINLTREALDLTPPEHPMRPEMLYNLSAVLRRRYTWTRDMGDMEESIEHLYEASELVKSGHRFSRRILHLLALNLLHRFKHSGADKDIADAIKHHRTSISLILEGSPEVSSTLSSFATGLFSVFFQTRDAEHLEESIALSRSAAEYPFSSVRDRLIAALTWTTAAHGTQHSSALTAYRQALSLLQRAIDLGPTVQNRYEYISGHNIEHVRSLPMDAASYAIESRAYEEAIEMLEQGRALLWSSMRSLRTPLDHLHDVDKSLADEFTEISQGLEALITIIDVGDFVQTPASTDDDDVTIGRKDTFSHTVATKRKLSKQLEEVVLRIQALPGFENFWRPVPFRHLQTAAIGGPVVIINLSICRSDILIVRPNHPVVHIPTPTNFFDRVTMLARQLSETRKSYRLESKKYARVLRQTLEELSELVGQPVANRLMELGIPEQSRIWLCPTSVLTSLPIHAAGPMSLPTNVKRYLCDIYVCSYTPSLSALIASRSRNLSGSASGRPSLLIVGQPDETLPGVDSETRSIECLIGSGSVTRIAGEAATPENVIARLPMHPWVHFACHGMLQPGRPFESCFLLQHNIHLTLLRIAKSHLPTAELAFLAACHTAELTEDGTPDEVLHLTAAVQFSGFRSVIGTLWAMVDEDGQDLSEHFYNKMFAAGVQNASYEMSARALRHATQKLRKKGVSLERWFVASNTDHGWPTNHLTLELSKSNWPEWSRRLELLASRTGFSKWLKGTLKRPEDEESKACWIWDSNDESLRGFILERISLIDYDLVSKRRTSHDIYEALRKRHERLGIYAQLFNRIVSMGPIDPDKIFTVLLVNALSVHFSYLPAAFQTLAGRSIEEARAAQKAASTRTRGSRPQQAHVATTTNANPASPPDPSLPASNAAPVSSTTPPSSSIVINGHSYILQNSSTSADTPSSAHIATLDVPLTDGDMYEYHAFLACNDGPSLVSIDWNDHSTPIDLAHVKCEALSSSSAPICVFCPLSNWSLNWLCARLCLLPAVELLSELAARPSISFACR
ncbi:CHAT domain-containing protein [Lactifluus subvellereus]|nr:CHAT domain-containing protein [Lactifluus subvellereus]